MYLDLYARTCVCMHMWCVYARGCAFRNPVVTSLLILFLIYTCGHIHTHIYRDKVICNPIYEKDWIRKILSTIRFDSIRFVAVLPTLLPRPLLTLKLAVSDHYFGFYIRDYICLIIHNESDFAGAPTLYDSWAERI